MIVELTQPNPAYPDLTAGRPYAVIGIEADDIRLLNDHGQPYLYPPDLFQITDDQRPPDWLIRRGDAGEQYAYPPAFSQPGFFEDFFDHQPAATTTFWQTLNARLAAV
jgi:hypothetical protein